MKNRNIHIVATLLLTFVVGPFWNANAATYQYQMNFDARYGNHYYGPPNIATHRHTLEYEQKAEYNESWSSVFGVRGEVEAAYATLPDRYSGEVGKADSQTLLPRDIYLQYKNGSFRSRLGYQQVVWGEAFGFYYADIVNPKDLREAGLGDLSRNRLATPMVNAQWIYSNSSVQILYIPKPAFNILPKTGSDFNSFALPAVYSGYTLLINREPENPPNKGEFGIRLTKQFGSLDLSAFYFNYYDRMPVFRIVAVTNPFAASAYADYRPLQTIGTTLTSDLNGYLVRSEILNHFSREMNTTDGLNLTTNKTNELIYVFGLDLPPLNKWQVGFQFSESRINNANWAAREATQSLASSRIARTFNGDVAIEALMSYFTSDASNLLQAKVTLPLSSQFELSLGVDKFDGRATTELGKFKNASRAWILFKGFVKK